MALLPMHPCAYPTCRTLTHQRLCEKHAPPPVTRESAMTILVCGPAGAGKSTYVRKQMQPGDLIVDVDALASALTGQPVYRDQPESLPYALVARDAVLAALARTGRSQRAWIVMGGARKDKREELRDRLNAYVIVLETPYEECIRRIEADERRSNAGNVWNQRVRDWWDTYRRSESDDVIAVEMAVTRA